MFFGKFNTYMKIFALYFKMCIPTNSSLLLSPFPYLTSIFPLSEPTPQGDPVFVLSHQYASTTAVWEDLSAQNPTTLCYCPHSFNGESGDPVTTCSFVVINQLWNCRYPVWSWLPFVVMPPDGQKQIQTHWYAKPFRSEYAYVLCLTTIGCMEICRHRSTNLRSSIYGTGTWRLNRWIMKDHMPNSN